MLILILTIEQKSTYKVYYFNIVQCNDVIGYDTCTCIFRTTFNNMNKNTTLEGTYTNSKNKV